MSDGVVRVAELRAMFELLIGRLEEVVGDSVELDDDYFWSIPWPAAVDVLQEPTELTVGQFSECLDNLHSMQDDDAVISYGLVWLGELLRAIGHQVVS